MRRRWSLVVAFVGVLGLIGLAPAVHGGHADPDKFPIDHPEIRHEHSPAPNVPPISEDLTGACVVAGAVEIGDVYGNGGISLDPAIKNHSHYKFQDVEIDCMATDPAFNRGFDVEAAGGTDGQGGQEDASGACTGMKEAKDDDVCHGENFSVGWSHSSCYGNENPKGPGGCGPFSSVKGLVIDDLYDGTNENPDGSGQCTNCGEIQAFSLSAGGIRDGVTDSTSTDNWMKFCRGVYDDGLHSPATCSNVLNGGVHSSTGGSNVLAWGALNPDQVGGSIACFLADLEFTPKQPGTPNSQQKINGAGLVGDALIWTVPNKDDCEGKKKPKP